MKSVWRSYEWLVRVAVVSLATGMIAGMIAGSGGTAWAGDGNRLTYLDEFCEPYYAHRQFPKLTTPQWVGDAKVEAVVTLGIDDMRAIEKYETFLRPLLDRLKEIDGRAPVSIMTCQVDPEDPHLQQWLGEGLTIETHTAEHPCPCLTGGDFARAKATYDSCVDQIASIPGNRPVAFRFPCCDSKNTPSPRAFAEILNKTTPNGNFLQLSTSVAAILTADDPELPRELAFDEEGRPRFSKYVPFPSFVNKVENYPYPFVIGRKIWEFPISVPDDWQGQHLNQPNNPETLRDLQAVVDATVIKKGVANIVFHPHNWIRNDQMVELVDHVQEKHGERVQFLTFGECLERINKHLLAGHPLRTATGADNGVRLLDLNNDGFLDVVIGNDQARLTRLWSPTEGGWIESSFPLRIVHSDGQGTADAGVRFGVLDDGKVSLIVRNAQEAAGWRFDGQSWVEDQTLLSGLAIDATPLWTSRDGRDTGVRLRDVDGDGSCELIVANPDQQAVFTRDSANQRWRRLPFSLPAEATIVDAEGRDAGLRFVDIDEDGHDDLVFSDERRYGLYLYESLETGWSTEILNAPRGEAEGLPPITRQGTNNGVWFADRHLWCQNEDTADLPDGVDRRSFNALLGDRAARPKSPAAALQGIEVPEGFEVQLVAAEPLIMDPVDFDWGPDGRLWVVEMADYPMGVDGKGTSGGRVRMLKDVDGDGVYDESTLVIDGLSTPTGIMVWREGVLVTAAPDVLYLEDTDGDGAADRRDVVLTGFGEGNQQHRVNGLRWGLDNWVYLANGDSGGTIVSPKTGETIDIAGRDLRIRPDEGRIDAQAGRTQFGRNRDDWGNWFGCNNPNPIFHYPLADHYLRRNPHIATPHPQRDIREGDAMVFPISRVISHCDTRYRPIGAPTTFTSASGTIVYRDDVLEAVMAGPDFAGPNFAGTTFTSEPVYNLVHRRTLHPQGVSFTSRRPSADRDREFFRSNDPWSRPTGLHVGPDGALYIADMYRQVIEHPEWIDDELEKQLDVRAGHDRGRIYRVSPVGVSRRSIPRLDQMSVPELVAALETPSGWQRDLIQRMLIWRGDQSAVAPLETMAVEGQLAVARLHAICTLDGLAALDPAIVVAALADPHPGVRRHAVRLAEPFLRDPPGPPEPLQKGLAAVVDDSDAQVRMQLAYTLGEWPSPQGAELLGRLARSGSGDSGESSGPYFAAALVSSIRPENLNRVLAAALSTSPDGKTAPAMGRQLLVVAAALGDPASLEVSMDWLASATDDRSWQWSSLSAMFEALRRRGESIDTRLSQSSLERIAALIEQARDIAADEEMESGLRIAAVDLLGRNPKRSDEDLAQLQTLLDPRNSTGLQDAVVTALSRTGDARAADALLAGWSGHTPAIRARIIDALLSRHAWTERLLSHLEQGQVLAAHLNASHRQRLIEHEKEPIKLLAQRLLAGSTDPHRQEVVERYRKVLAMSGDANRGKLLFAQRCAVCHKLENVGHSVGPDLAAITNRSPEAMLIAILDPNRAVEDKFLTYQALTVDGRVLTGMLIAETATSITLVGQEGTEQVLLRGQIETLRGSGKSLMPEGVEKDLSPQELSDLIQYVSGQLAAIEEDPKP